MTASEVRKAAQTLQGPGRGLEVWQLCWQVAAFQKGASHMAPCDIACALAGPSHCCLVQVQVAARPSSKVAVADEVFSGQIRVERLAQLGLLTEIERADRRKPGE